jgi:hypothetical protein
MNAWSRIVRRCGARAAFACSCALILACCWFWDTPTLPPLVVITSPADGAVINGVAVTVSGTASVEDEVWVFVYPEKAGGRGYPQAADTYGTLPSVRGIDGTTWQVHCGLGGDPQQYVIKAFTATPAASSALKQTYRQWREDDFFPGLQAVPEGFTERSQVSIRRGS